MRVSALAAVLVAVLALPGSGCGDADFGDLLVKYRIGSGAQGCDDVGVQVIRVTLANSERAPIVEEAVCSDTRPEVLLRQVPADVYTVSIEGIDGNEVSTFSGSQENVRVVADSINETREIAMNVTPPGLRLIWGFSDGMMCGLHNVEELHVVLYRDSISLEYDEMIDCTSGITEIEELLPGVYDLRVRAVDGTSGDYTFEYDRDGIELQAGGMVQVVASLEACPESCSAP